VSGGGGGGGGGGNQRFLDTFEKVHKRKSDFMTLVRNRSADKYGKARYMERGAAKMQQKRGT